MVLDATRNNVVLDRTPQQTVEPLAERWEELSEDERLVLNLFVEDKTTPASAISLPECSPSFAPVPLEVQAAEAGTSFALGHTHAVAFLTTTRMFCSSFNTNHNFGHFR